MNYVTMLNLAAVVGVALLVLLLTWNQDED